MYKCPKCNQCELVTKYVLPGICLLCLRDEQNKLKAQELIKKNVELNRRNYYRV
jgi:hypothetical protein